MKRKLFLLVLVAVLLSGCAGYQRVQHPPKVTVGGSNTIAVLFFDNFTDDYAISHEVEQELVKTLSGYYRVLPPAEVEWALVRLGLLRGQSPDRNQAVRLGQMLGVDALVMGEVSAYFQPINQTPPYPTGKTTKDEKGNTLYQYEYLETTQVMVGFTGRVMETRSGNVIHRLRVEGQSQSERKEIVRWPREWWPEGRRPSTWDLPNPSYAQVPYVRQNAIRQAVSHFVQDLMPTYTWERVEQ
ncbi:MAG TPA: hypothetical protein PLM25_04575 [Limnochordia bacterium]|nr:hypothetical protein [Limnochordia bacterium]